MPPIQELETDPTDPLSLLPPGSPDIDIHPQDPSSSSPSSLNPIPNPPISLPRSFHSQSLRALSGLSQKEVDGIRIHFYLLFYEEHALLWSSLEQHFSDMDEVRVNRALAWLEEEDAVEIQPAPPPNPFSPPDALVSLIPHSGIPRDLALAPLPWPGSHIHSPQIPQTPGYNPSFGWKVNLNEEDYFAATTGGGNTATGTGVETRMEMESGRQTATRRTKSKPRPGLGPGNELNRGLSTGGLKMGGHHLETLSTLSQAGNTGLVLNFGSSSPSFTNPHGHGHGHGHVGGDMHLGGVYPTFSEVARYKVGTVTPPPSNRWMSEESTPLFRPKRFGAGDNNEDDDLDEEEDEDDVEPYSLDDHDLDEETIEPGGVVNFRPGRSGSGSGVGSGAGQRSNGNITPQVGLEGSVSTLPAQTPRAKKPALKDDKDKERDEDEGMTYIEPPRGFEGDTDLGTTTWNVPRKRSESVVQLSAQQESERLEELWQIAASVVPPMPVASSSTSTSASVGAITEAGKMLKPRPLPMWLPAILLPLAASLVLHPILYAASTSSTLPLPSLIQDFTRTLPAPTFPALEANIGFSIVAFLGMLYAVPWMGDAFVAKDLKGLDLLKGVHGTVIPECMGLPGAAGYIGLMIMFIPFPFSKYFEDSLNGWGIEGAAKNGDLESLRMEQAVGRRTFPHQELALFLSSILSLLIATLLGFLDDVFDIRWRHKLPIPIIASIPLLMVYYAEGGLTTVVMPIGARWLFGNTVNLGPLYYIYMSLLSTFSTNGINILAGVNGLEVGQALVIALSVAFNDALYLPIWPRIAFGEPGALNELVLLEGGPVLRRGSEELIQRHLLSLYFMGPLIGVCLGLLYHNWFPARAFVGDTFCYFAGMAFAVVAIQGHFSKTLLLFFIPQIFNFVLSVPQLFGLVPCPRHRLPKLDPTTGLLQPSTVVFVSPPQRKTVLTLKLLAMLGLTRITYDKDGETIVSATNLTLYTLILVYKPMREDKLTMTIMWLQFLGSVMAFFVRYGIASLLYDGDRR